MLNEQRPLKVFLSYASQDRPVVRELSRRLVGEGWIDPWLDEKKLLPGQDWRLKIEEAVETSDIVIICLSSNSVTKEGYVQKELRYAREIALEKPDETIFLIPLRLDDCETPRGLRFYQWVDYFGEKKDGSYNALIESLRLRHEQKLQLEEAERIREEKERLEHEAAEKVLKEKAESETAEKVAREKEKRDAAEKVKRERAERLAAQLAALKKTFSKAMPFLRIGGIFGIILVILRIGSLVMPAFLSLVPTAEVLTTTSSVTQIASPTKAPEPGRTPTKVFTPTFTPLPINFGFNLVYISEQDGKRSLYSLNSEGQRSELLESEDFGYIGNPAWSPHGDLIAIETDKGIYSVDLNTGLLEKLSSSGIKPVWSPDSLSIALETGDLSKVSYDYTRCQNLYCWPDTAYVSSQKIYAISLTSDTLIGTYPRIAYRGVHSLKWSRDGSKYAYIRKSNVDLICIKVATNLRPDECVPVKDYVGGFDWSPSGNKIVFSVSRKENLDIFFLNIDDSSQINLTNGAYNNYSPIWSHSGEQIAFVSDRDGNNEIYVMDTTNLIFENITQNISNDFSPLWSPDDNEIIFVSDRNGNFDVFSIDIDTGEIKNLTNAPGDEFFPVVADINP